jgi:hypothetical protein
LPVFSDGCILKLAKTSFKIYRLGDIAYDGQFCPSDVDFRVINIQIRRRTVYCRHR